MHSKQPLLVMQAYRRKVSGNAGWISILQVAVMKVTVSAHGETLQTTRNSPCRITILDLVPRHGRIITEPFFGPIKCWNMSLILRWKIGRASCRERVEMRV